MVIEEYVDEAAACAHNTVCGALLEQIGEVSEMSRVDVHSALGTGLQKWIAKRPEASSFSPLAE